MTTTTRVLGERYELQERIGAGGMAEVYRAHDRRMDRSVAVKLLPATASGQALERFRREAHMAATLSHPNVVAVYDWGLDDGTAYLVMEHVRGANLRELLRQRGPLDADRALDVAIQVARALDAAHRAGIVHRDVKPHNILVDETGCAKVVDFGIARSTGTADGQTQVSAVLGTVHYLSPEQAEGRPADARSDLYGLGVVLYELLTGRVPFAGDSPPAVLLQLVRDEPTPPRQLRPNLSPGVEAVVLRALAKDLNRRYQTADELRAALEEVRRGLEAERSATQPIAVVPRPASAPRRPASAPRRPASAPRRPASALPRPANGPPRRASAAPLSRQGPHGLAPPRRRHARVWPGALAPPTFLLRRPGTLAAVAAVVLALAWGVTAARSGLSVGALAPAVAASAEVPALAARTLDEAQAAAAAASLVLKVSQEPTLDTPAGLVVTQEPLAGQRLPRGGAIQVVVSTGVQVPDLVGQQCRDARAQAAARRWSLRPVRWRIANIQDFGKIVQQDPPGGGVVPATREIQVHVAGPVGPC